MTTDSDHLAPDRDRQYVSMGYLCQLLQCLPAQLRVLMDDCGVRFSMTFDESGYLTVAEAERLAAKCRDIHREIAAAVETVANTQPANN